MDLRSIINADTSGAAPTRAAQLAEVPPLQGFQHHQQKAHSGYEPPPSSYHGYPQARPAQPPPINPPNDFRSSGGPALYSVAHSPYQQTPSSLHSTGQYPFPLAPAQSPSQTQAPQYPPRQGHPSPVTAGYQSYGSQTATPYTPTAIAPGSPQYSYHQRPQSSHSTTTPTSAQSQAPGPYSHRESPFATPSQGSSSTQSHPYQHHQSQPATPLGPPVAFNRASIGLSREASASYDHQRNHSGGSYPHSQVAAPSPISQTFGSSVASPVAYGPRHSLPDIHDHISQEDRERSLSVSPKTRLPSQTRMEPLAVTQSAREPWLTQVTPAKRKMTEDSPDHQRPRELDNRYSLHDPRLHVFDDRSTYHNQKQQATLADGSIMNGAMSRPYVNEQHGDSHGLPSGERLTHINTISPTMTPGADSVLTTRETSRPGSRGQPSSASSSVTPSLQQPLTPRAQSNRETPTSQASPTPPASQNAASTFAPPAPPKMATLHATIKPEAGVSVAPASSSEQPSRKRPRHDEPPIFARKASRGNPLLPNKRTSAPKSATPVKQELLMKQEPMEAKPPAALISSVTALKDSANGNAVASNDVPLPKGQPELGDHGPLGPWESTILGGVIPYEDLTRTISDWLFQQVVTREDVGTGPAGGGPGLGAILEIEAKIGQIIDLNRGERLRLPVLTECVISQSDPSIRTKFESSMTESQHRALNGFLNKALLSSQPIKTTPTAPAPSKPRIPMSYVHTRECDASYELKSSSYHTLPPSVRALINPRHRPRVRITTDQKTGRELAKIIKMRVADIEIYSPRTLFDWRVSVSLEMNYDGDMRDLEESTEGGKRADRNKDRMSYKHLAYQIDLTQVTPAEATSKADKVHELEIEVSSAEVRRQGLLAQRGEISQYEDLVKGFVDNVRVLARHCQ